MLSFLPRRLEREDEGEGDFSRRALVRNVPGSDRDDQREEEEDDCEAEGKPSNDFLRAALLRFGEDVQTAAGNGAGSAFRLTALEQGKDDDDEGDNQEDDVIPFHVLLSPFLKA